MMPAKRKRKPSIARLVRRAARRAGVLPKAPRVDRIICCASHAFSELNFSSPCALVAYVDDLARERQGHRAKPLASVRLPSAPAWARSVVARRHADCGGVGCASCGMMGWSVTFTPRVPRSAKQRACTHDTAPTEPL